MRIPGGRHRIAVVLAASAMAGGLAAACGGGAEPPAASAVSVELLAQDSAGARFRICNNGFQPVRHVEFSAGGSSFSADTLLDQAHCAEIARSGPFPPIDSASVTVTAVGGPSR